MLGLLVEQGLAEAASQVLAVVRVHGFGPGLWLLHRLLSRIFYLLSNFFCYESLWSTVFVCSFNVNGPRAFGQE